MIASGTFTAIEQVSAVLSLEPHQSAEIILTNTGGHTWRVDLERVTKGNAGHMLIQSFTGDTASTRWLNDSNQTVRLRLRCITLDTDPDTDSVDYTLQDTVSATAVQLVCIGPAKVGATAGFVVNAATDVGKLATLPKAITAGTLVVPLPRLAVGDRIVGAYLVGSLQGASTMHTTILLDIRKLVAATAGATDASVAAMAAALDVQADTVVSKANTQIQLDHVVAEATSYYALITATTADDNACTATVLAVVLQIIPAA